MEKHQRCPTQASMAKERRRTLEPKKEFERPPMAHQDPEAAKGKERRRTLVPNQEPQRQPTTHQEQEVAGGKERRRTLEPNQELKTTQQEQEAVRGRTRRRTLEPNQEPERRLTTPQEQKKRRHRSRSSKDKKRLQSTLEPNKGSEHPPGAAPNPSSIGMPLGEDVPSFSNHDLRMPPPPPALGIAASSHASVNQPNVLPDGNHSAGSSTFVIPLALKGISKSGSGVVMAQVIYFPVGDIEPGGSVATAPRQDTVSSNPAMAGSGIPGLHSFGTCSPVGETAGSNGADHAAYSNETAPSKNYRDGSN